MASRKNRPVPFEVVARTQRASRRRSQQQRAASVAGSGVCVSGAGGSVPSAWQPGSDSVGRASGLRMAGGRLQVSLGWPQLLVAGILLAAVLVGTFEAGVRSTRSPASPPPDFEELVAGGSGINGLSITAPVPGQGRSPDVVTPPVQATRGAPDERAVAGQSHPPGAQLPETFAFAPDSYYVVVQHFPRRAREAADQACSFLRSRGVQCVVHPGQGDWMVVATQRFATERQAADLVARIRELGKEYFPIGRYDFKDAAARKF